MSENRIRVLFVCTGNSARSQIAEALLRAEGGDAFEVFSAGTEPRGVHPLTVRAMANVGIDISGARSKSVLEFRDEPFDYVITLCDRARASCPVFPGRHETMHWGFDDPAEAEGPEADRLMVFERVLGEIGGRLRLFIPIALRGQHASAPMP